MCTNKDRPILMSNIVYHFEWFRREMERCVADDDEERSQRVTYLLDIMEQRIRSTGTHTVPVMTVHVYHFEWFRREMERCVADDDEERSQRVTYLLDIMEQRIRSAGTHTVPVMTVHAEPRVDSGDVPCPPGVTSVTPGVQRIVGGRMTMVSHSAPVARTRPGTMRHKWHLSSSSPRSWSHEVNRSSRRRR